MAYPELPQDGVYAGLPRHVGYDIQLPGGGGGVKKGAEEGRSSEEGGGDGGKVVKGRRSEERGGWGRKGEGRVGREGG